MFNFKKSQSYLGIDIGTTSIKIVELKRVGGQPRLINYSYSDEIADFSRTTNQLDIDKVAGLLNKICQQAGISSNNAITAMPSFAVFSSVLNINSANNKDLATAVMWEAKKVVPLDLEEMILDWKIIEDKPKNKDKSKEESAGDSVLPAAGKTKVLLTGAPKSLVKNYVDIFKKAKINLLSLETEMFSLVRALIGNDPATITIVDLGAVNTDIAIIENGMPMFSRSLDTGGIMITKAIADRIKVDFKRAEQFKMDLNSSMESGDQSMLKIVSEVIRPIENEIKYSLDLFQRENNKKIEKVILSGGGANLASFADRLSQLLDAKVIIGDPWARLAYPMDLKPVLEELGPKMAIAIGLALREVD